MHFCALKPIRIETIILGTNIKKMIVPFVGQETYQAKGDHGQSTTQFTALKNVPTRLDYWSMHH